MPRRGRGGPGLTTIYWRDIPAQVTATTEDGGKEQVLMHDRFQVGNGCWVFARVTWLRRPVINRMGRTHIHIGDTAEPVV